MHDNVKWLGEFKVRVKEFEVKIARLSYALVHQEITCLRGKAAINGTRLLSIYRQVRAYLWHEGPVGGLNEI